MISNSTITALKEWPIKLNPGQVRAALTEAYPKFRFPVAVANSTENGYHTSRTYFRRLRFEFAVARVQSSMMVAIAGPCGAPADVHYSVPDNEFSDPNDCARMRVRPRWDPGDRLWVKETFAAEKPYPPKSLPMMRFRADGQISAELQEHLGPWIGADHMPRWASRIRLEVSGVATAIIEERCYWDVRCRVITCKAARGFWL